MAVRDPKKNSHPVNSQTPEPEIYQKSGQIFERARSGFFRFWQTMPDAPIEGVSTTLGAIVGLRDFMSMIGSAITFILGFNVLSSGGSNRASASGLSRLIFDSLPIRIFLVALAIVTLGWFFAYCASTLVKKSKESLLFLAYLITVFLALFLVIWLDVLFGPEQARSAALGFLLTALSISAALLVSRISFEKKREPSLEALNHQSALLLTFTGTSTLVAVITLISRT
jgi:hypothetical protein